ncbi:MAG: tRNA uridine-5-carboxymethylaminomethyl(34) synthesis GTPase MnmE [Acidobacteriota bacterium]
MQNSKGLQSKIQNLKSKISIAAIATPPGYGGIGVIRLSGPDAVAIARRLLDRGPSLDFKPNHASLHQIVRSSTSEVIDQAIVTFFESPHSFTGEDVIEIAGHGSPVVLAEVLRELLALGARAAEPGEFSMRAFLNGRMDLAQAEAIRDLIHAQTTYQARVAARQLRGELSNQLRPVKERLVKLIVHFESAVEFVEDDLEALDIARFSADLESMREVLGRLAESYRIGRIIRSGMRLALIGRPNVGKSSIFNALLGRDRAIVTPVPGTTRDALTEVVALRGIPVELVDTAGIRETEDVVERLGVERTRAAASEADLIISVLDANATSIDGELEPGLHIPADIHVLNKCDLAVRLTESDIEALGETGPVIHVSALTGAGIDELRDAIYERISGGYAGAGGEGAIITNERHFAALESAMGALDRAREDLGAGLTEEVALANLHDALGSLGVITGETLIADIINQIFATFCIGK